MNTAITIDCKTRRPETPAMQAAFDAIDASVAKYRNTMDDTTARIGQWNAQFRRYKEAVDLISCHYYPTINEQTAAGLLARYGIRLGSLGDVSLAEMINDARRLLGRPEGA